MVTAEFDKLIQGIGSTSVVAKRLRQLGFPYFAPSTINYWYSCRNIHPNVKYFTALVEIGKMYGIDISRKGLSGL